MQDGWSLLTGCCPRREVAELLAALFLETGEPFRTVRYGVTSQPVALRRLSASYG